MRWKSSVRLSRRQHEGETHRADRTPLRAQRISSGQHRAVGHRPAFAAAAAQPAAQPASRDNETATPIKHVIVIVGENRSFDHVFATYVPNRTDQTVSNLLSRGIVNADGTPGPNFSHYAQRAAKDEAPDAFMIDPPKKAFKNGVLPAPLVGGPKTSYIPNQSLALAKASENALRPTSTSTLSPAAPGKPPPRLTSASRTSKRSLPGPSS